jgi:hypothetical protein
VSIKFPIRLVYNNNGRAVTHPESSFVGTLVSEELPLLEGTE